MNCRYLFEIKNETIKVQSRAVKSIKLKIDNYVVFGSSNSRNSDDLRSMNRFDPDRYQLVKMEMLMWIVDDLFKRELTLARMCDVIIISLFMRFTLLQCQSLSRVTFGSILSSLARINYYLYVLSNSRTYYQIKA